MTERVPFREKFFVGTGGISVFFGTYAVKALAFPVYNMMLGLSPGWLGVCLTIPRLWDAFIDPWVGHVSDNWRSRFGRRRPFIVAGAIASAIAYGLIWMVPLHWSGPGKLAWLLGTSLIFYTAFAVFAVPYQSLTFELSPDYDERTTVMACSSVWYKIGSASFDWLFPLSQAAFWITPIFGVRSVCWGAGLVMMGLLGMLPAAFGKERYLRQAERQAKTPFWPTLRSAMSSRPLVILIVLTMLGLAASFIASGMDTYLLVYYIYHGNLATGTKWKGVLTTGYAVIGFISIPIINRIAQRFGKKPTVIGAYVLNVVAGIGKWFIFTPGIGWWLMLDPLLSSPNLTTINMVIPAMVADICDEDELEHGLRREGMFGAVFLWIQKTGIALSFLVAGLVLSFSGFEATKGAAQSPRTFLWMRLALSGATALTSVAAIFVATKYPLTKARAEQTRRTLEARRGTV